MKAPVFKKLLKLFRSHILEIKKINNLPTDFRVNDTDVGPQTVISIFNLSNMVHIKWVKCALAE